MELKLFRNGKKLMCRLPGEDKDIPAADLFLGAMFFKPEKLKEKLGEELPVLVPTCEITKQEEIDIAKLNKEIEEIVTREQVLRAEIAKIITELEG